ncbi:U-box domain-containing protein 32 isoform X2 [Beta vulgaris subsp. vulgaris]|nr:U-box domain-containing protein 32 isoform X2 [Beta vulgaris subsp. vulgaris]
MWIEMENIEDGIVKMIAQHGIKWLVMGAAADKHYTKEMAELKSQKAIFVYEQAPVSCHIWFTCRGNLIYTREGLEKYPSVEIPQTSESQNSNVATEESDHIRLSSPESFLRPQPVDVMLVTEEGNLRVEAPAADGLSPDSDFSTEESESKSLESDAVSEEDAEGFRVNDPSADTRSIQSNVVAEEPGPVRIDCQPNEPGPVRVEAPAADGLSLDSDFSAEESESKSLESDAEGVRVNNPSADTLSIQSNVVAEEPGPVRIDCQPNEHGSPPRLTFRERGSILRACSVDFNSDVEKCMVLSSSQDCRHLHDCIGGEKEDNGYEGNLQMFKFRSSFDSVLSKGKMAGKGKLLAPRESHGKMEQAISDAESLKQLAFRESVNRWKAEEDAMDAKRKADAAEIKYYEEMKKREEIEEALSKQKLACGRIKEEHEKYMKELPVVQDQCFGLKSQIRESEIAAKELEEKIISAVQLLISFRDKRDQIQVEHDKAVEEREKLKILKQQRTKVLSGLHFSTFSLLEIGEVTCSFDPSKRIGDGRHGSIYRGMLRHVDVAIRMLPNDGFLSQQMFESRVEIVSRIRHPNIVTLIGICPEARSIVYKYLERGSLEDHLACKGKSLPLQWQTRVRIAKELCSALIFLHSKNPPIFHGNMKPTKVLLDANFISKLSDLGMFFLIPQNQLPNNSHSPVYIDPEFLETGVLTQYSDIYSFGMILLQLLTSRPASGIVRDVKCALQKDKFESVLDFSAGEWPVNEAKTLARMALRCCERNPSKRPDLALDMWNALESLSKSCDPQASCSQKKENKRPPSHFLCPIYQEVMTDPCTAADGYTYEGDAIRGWLDSGHITSPMTNLKLSSCSLIPNHALQYAIQEWLQRS